MGSLLLKALTRFQRGQRGPGVSPQPIMDFPTTRPQQYSRAGSKHQLLQSLGANERSSLCSWEKGVEDEVSPTW